MENTNQFYDKNNRRVSFDLKGSSINRRCDIDAKSLLNYMQNKNNEKKNYSCLKDINFLEIQIENGKKLI